MAIQVKYSRSLQAVFDSAYNDCRRSADLHIFVPNYPFVAFRVHHFVLIRYPGLTRVIKKPNGVGTTGHLDINGKYAEVNLLVKWLYQQPWGNLRIDPMNMKCATAEVLFDLGKLADKYQIKDLQDDIVEIFSRQVVSAQKTIRDCVDVAMQLTTNDARGRVEALFLHRTLELLSDDPFATPISNRSQSSDSSFTC